MNGRPLRFLGATLAIWVAARAVMLWPIAPSLPTLAGAIAPAAAAATLPTGDAPAPSPIRPIEARPTPEGKGYLPRQSVTAGRVPIMESRSALATSRSIRRPDAAQGQAAEPFLPPPLPPTPADPRSRLSGSFWAIARGAGDDRSVPGTQLGGSQAGVRVTYALGEDRRVAVAARVSTPLAGRGREAALGVEWRPLDAPVRLIAERRWSLDGGRGGPTLMAVAGLAPTRLGPLAAEAYAQAGAIARDRVDGFVDGAARLSARLPARRLRLDLGIGAWGGAQPGAARLDLGPTLGLGVPVGGRRLRMTLDWRQRVAGGARPGSGPALSIGSDF